MPAMISEKFLITAPPMFKWEHKNWLFLGDFEVNFSMCGRIFRKKVMMQFYSVMGELSKTAELCSKFASLAWSGLV